jgi:hypothetical protein
MEPDDRDKRIVLSGALRMIAFLLWCMLFVLCWPVALLALIAYPFVWLLLLPFRIVGIAVHGVLALVAAVIMLPFRLLSAPFRVAGI